MPKETIRDQATMYDMVVGWSRDPAGYVQVGIETTDGTTIASRLFEEGDLRGQLLSMEQQAEADKEAKRRFDNVSLAQFTGLWGTLDREGCNRMIRALRRARDQAFGADA